MIRARILGGLAAVLLSGSMTQAYAQTTLASNGTGTSNSGSNYAVGQSFTTSAASPSFNSIKVSFQDTSGANVGAAGSKVYIFSSAYAGTPSGLSSANSLGSAAYNNGEYSFSTNFSLAGNTQYYAYTDTLNNFGYANSSLYSGGNLYASYNNNTFTNYTGLDARFAVTGIAAAAPEPATWALMIVGFGFVGGTLRRTRRQQTARLALLAA